MLLNDFVAFWRLFYYVSDPRIQQAQKNVSSCVYTDYAQTWFTLTIDNSHYRLILKLGKEMHHS
jgi:hypothetical protein